MSIIMLGQTMKRHLTISLLIFILCFISSCRFGKGKIYQTFNKNINENFSILVTAHHESCRGFPCGVYYTYYSQNRITTKKIRLLEKLVDDPNDIHSENIVVKRDSLAYFWFLSHLRTTNDGGKTWSSWEADFNTNLEVDYYLIKKVEINRTGIGEMSLTEYVPDKNGILKLITTDFGKTWRKP